MEQERMIVCDTSEWRGGECMSIDAALRSPGGGSHTSGVILGSYQLQGGRGNELNMKWHR